VAKLRGITKIRTIGHTGTLDPFATGLLIVAIGREATKKIDTFLKLDKTYEATMQLGATTDTQDVTGIITKTPNPTNPSETDIGEALTHFTGPISQIPPMFSAKKINGKKLYELARAGQTIERKPNQVTIHQLLVTSYQLLNHQLSFTVHCSSGTYIRTLAHDIGQCLGTGAYLTQLRRTKIGNHDIKDAITINQITADNWQTFVKKY